MNQEEPVYDYSMNVTIDDVRLLHYCVKESIRVWPGSPARPYGEQEHMWAMRDQFQRMLLDYQFTNS